jgi:two-component system, NtrC family, nitrogen regulation response regulator NtrX
MSSEYILVVDDEPDIRRLLREILEDEKYEVASAENAAAARAEFKQRRPDLVLLDIWMPDGDGITLLKEWFKDGTPEFPVIMISGHGTVETAVDALRLGAYDFIEKPLSTAKLLITVEHALQNAKLRKENTLLLTHAESLPTLVGRSSSVKTLRAGIERIAAHDTPVLITGESGSGKHLVARTLHAASARKEHGFIQFNLTPLPDPHVASHLFGREQDGVVHAGSLEQAGQGILFLDEIGDMDLPTQAMLASALEERQFRHVGGSQAITLAARIVAATHVDLKKAVIEGRFREDLFYHLSVAPLQVAALRDHREDVPELVSYYVNWMVENEQLPYRKFSTGALNVLRNYSWPGNVRELRNLVQRLLMLNQGEEVTQAEVAQALAAQPAIAKHAFPVSLFDLPLREARDNFEKQYLEYHLQRTGGNVGELAQIVEMERTHLYRKLKGLGIDPKNIK